MLAKRAWSAESGARWPTHADGAGVVLRIPPVHAGPKTSINNNETKQVSMLDGTGVPVRKRYVVDGQAMYYRNVQHPGSPLQGRRAVYYEFKNDAKRRPRACRCRREPCASTRPTRRAASSSPARTASTTRRRTKRCQLQIGTAFDVVCERNQTRFQKIGSVDLRDGGTRSSCATTRRVPIEVKVNEPIGGSWRMVNASHPWKQTSAWAQQLRRAGRRRGNSDADVPRGRHLLTRCAKRGFRVQGSRFSVRFGVLAFGW